MKNIDIKSLIIGVLLTSTIIFGMGATSPTDKWDDKQEWAVKKEDPKLNGSLASSNLGWEPFAVAPTDTTVGEAVWLRKRIK